MGSVIQACAESVFRNAGDEHARRALGDALAHPMLAPQVLAPWTPPMEPPPDNRFRAAAHIQRRARGMATRTGSPPPLTSAGMPSAGPSCHFLGH